MKEGTKKLNRKRLIGFLKGLIEGFD